MEDTLKLVSDAKRARKRAWDRVAQRSSRLRTKARIEYLEQQIRLREPHASETPNTRILATNEKLRAENDALKDQIRKAISTLSPNHGILQLLQKDKAGTPFTGLEIGDLATGPSNQKAEPVKIGQRRRCHWNMCQIKNILPVHEPCACPGVSVQTIQYGNHGICLIPGRGLARSPLYLSTMPQTISTGPQSVRWDSDPEMILSYHSRCFVWCTVNNILSEIFTSKVEHVDTVSDAPGLLFKGIIEGWDVSNMTNDINPIVSILGRMDQYIWSTSPTVQRLAIAYKSYQLLTYILNPGSESRQAIPGWELPTPVQLSVEHPIAIDFFPWPVARDHLIVNYSKYLQICDFFSDTHRYTNFNWPYRLDECFSCDHDANYQPSLLFIQHVNNLFNWSLCPHFFERYPEFIGKIPQTEIPMLE